MKKNTLVKYWSGYYYDVNWPIYQVFEVGVNSTKYRSANGMLQHFRIGYNMERIHIYIIFFFSKIPELHQWQVGINIRVIRQNVCPFCKRGKLTDIACANGEGVYMGYCVIWVCNSGLGTSHFGVYQTDVNMYIFYYFSITVWIQYKVCGWVSVL